MNLLFFGQFQSLSYSVYSKRFQSCLLKNLNPQRKKQLFYSQPLEKAEIERSGRKTWGHSWCISSKIGIPEKAKFQTFRQNVTSYKLDKVFIQEKLLPGMFCYSMLMKD